MIRRLFVFTASGVLIAGAAAAAPLCQTSKGLFTPCPPKVIEAARIKRAAAERARQEEASRQDAAAATPPGQAEAAVTAGEPREVQARAERRHGLFGMGKLCRDSKGLATPCPR